MWFPCISLIMISDIFDYVDFHMESWRDHPEINVLSLSSIHLMSLTICIMTPVEHKGYFDKCVTGFIFIQWESMGGNTVWFLYLVCGGEYIHKKNSTQHEIYMLALVLTVIFNSDINTGYQITKHLHNSFEKTISHCGSLFSHLDQATRNTFSTHSAYLSVKRRTKPLKWQDHGMLTEKTTIHDKNTWI